MCLANAVYANPWLSLCMRHTRCGIIEKPAQAPRWPHPGDREPLSLLIPAENLGNDAVFGCAHG